MFDLLLDVLGELLGLGGKEQPVRRQAPARRQGGGEPVPQPPPRREGAEATLDSLLRQMVGVEEAPPPPPPPPARRDPERERQLRERPEGRKREGGPSRTPPPPVRSIPADAPPAVPFADPAPVLAASGGGSGLDFIGALRSDPDAARRAFVFSEIFGKPVADR